ncbi:hypothetical protein C8Q74DRAFT_1253160 [Fomes fomentarius]|nr:hypothetical protein C8Q74DRAFT_1253160 [Fomes fomentarius]
MDASIVKGQEKTADDGLFMERLDMLYEQSLGDLRAFAEREGRAYHEVKRRMAELHCRSLFVGATTQHASSTLERKQLIDRVLRIVSQQLESLENVAGLQSFFLVVNPNDLRDEGFLGGTITGREFWRGHRGCGAAGVEAFKARCVRSQVNAPRQVMTAGSSHLPPTPQLHPYSDVPRKKSQAREVKAELYGAMRDALRVTSGIRNAEMKWTNHSNLDVYGVRIVGWPDDVPQQNPSTLSVAQNRLILELLNGGKLHFVHMDGTTTAEASHGVEEVPQRDEDMMFADSIDYSWVSEGSDGNSFIHEAGSFLPGYGKTNSSHTSQDTAGMSTDNVEAMTAKKRRIEGS